MRIAVMHLDLGIGGAEQLIVNVAKLLQETPNEVKLFTTHHNPGHCFEETKPDGVLGQHIYVYGDWLPRHILRRLTALCATIRMIFLTFCLLAYHIWWLGERFDVVILDGVSTPIPLLWLAGLPVLFYCHFPDMLLCVDRSSLGKSLYRGVMDSLEAWTTSFADQILVNSYFTAQVFRETFPGIDEKKVKLQVLYPVVEQEHVTLSQSDLAQLCPYAPRKSYEHVFVSLNRFERKKKVELAVGAFARVKELRKQTKDAKPLLLVIAGGYDMRVDENREYLAELQQYCDKLGLHHCHLKTPEAATEQVDVVFRTSITSQERTALFHCATALLYTPDREHFGIVPLEAMGQGLPVLAVSSGGPLETVRHNRTGFLCAQNEQEFARFMHHLATGEDANPASKQVVEIGDQEKPGIQSLDDIDRINKTEALRHRQELSALARERVQKQFSARTMQAQLEDIVRILAHK